MNIFRIRKLAPFYPEAFDGLQYFQEWELSRGFDPTELNGSMPGPVELPHLFEVHPYREKFQRQMPLKPSCYIIGTAPPASYLRNEDLNSGTEYKGPIVIGGKEVGSAPKLYFYHGNKNSFWDAIGFSSETIEEIMSALRIRNIRYDDILLSWSRKDFSSTDDKDLTDIIPNMYLLMDIWRRDDSPFLWFTSSPVFGKKGIKIHANKRKIYKGLPEQQTLNERGKVICHDTDLSPYTIFLRAWQEAGAIVFLRLNQNQDWVELNVENKQRISRLNETLRHDLKIEWKGGTRSYSVLTGPSPSRLAAQKMPENNLYQKWLNDARHISDTPTTAFKNYVYNQFLDWIAEHPSNA